MNNPTCSLPECELPRYARDWCRRHYNRWHRCGDPRGPQAPRAPKPQRLCSLDGCSEKHSALGLCGRHYRQDDYQRRREIHKAKQALYRNDPQRQALRREQARERRLADPVRTAAANRAYHRDNPDKIREQKRRYRDLNRDAIRALNAKRRALQRNAPVNDLTAQQWAEIRAAYRHRCVYCHCKPKRLTMDHVIPLSGGGPHTASNVVPACVSCNSRKNNRPAPEYQPILI